MKIIYDPVKNKSKGFGFVEFTNYKEFNRALNNKNPVILGKQKLVFNSGKNRYDELDEINSFENNYILHNDSNISQTLTQQSSTTEIGNSISNFNNSFITHSSKNSFVEDIYNKKPNLKKIYERINEDDIFQYEISNAFKSIFDMIQKNNFQSYQCNYYCNINLFKNEKGILNNNNSLSRKSNISIYGNKNISSDDYFNKYEINYNT